MQFLWKKKLSEGRQQQIQVFEWGLGAVLKEEQGGRWKDDVVRKCAWSASWKTWVPSLEPEIKDRADSRKLSSDLHMGTTACMHIPR